MRRRVTLSIIITCAHVSSCAPDDVVALPAPVPPRRPLDQVRRHLSFSSSQCFTLLHVHPVHLMTMWPVLDLLHFACPSWQVHLDTLMPVFSLQTFIEKTYITSDMQGPKAVVVSNSCPTKRLSERGLQSELLWITFAEGALY